MAQKQFKRYRRAAEKTAKANAFNLAQAQIQEIMKAPLKMRLKFCWGVLFPPKAIRMKDKVEIVKKARGLEGMKSDNNCNAN